MRSTFKALGSLILIGCAGALGVSCAGLRGPFDGGPVVSRDRSPEGHARRRALGPIMERQEAADGKRFSAVRPLYARTEDPANEGRCLQEFLWPLAMHKEFRNETYWRLLFAFGHDFDASQPGSRYRAVVFPFVAAGRDAAGDGYFGLFPLGGEVHEFLGRDRIRFALWPLWTESTINEVRTVDVLFPIFSRTVGDGISRARVFPLYGRSSLEGAWTKRFVLWPLWTSASYQYPDGQEGGGFILFPLFGHTKLSDQETWMLLPPFVRWSRNDEGYRAANCPWPFVQYRSGKDERMLYLWPLWGRREIGDVTSTFALWPIVSTLDLERGREHVSRFSIFPLLFHEKVEIRAHVADDADRGSGGGLGRVEQAESDGWVETAGDPRADGPEAGVSGRYFKLWPLASYRREASDFRVRVPDLWPGKGLAAVERNYAPLWTLYSHARCGESSEDELLWGIWRRQNTADERGFSLFPLFSRHGSEDGARRRWKFLMGLVGYRREGLQREFQMLYFLKFRRNGTAPGGGSDAANEADGEG